MVINAGIINVRPDISQKVLVNAKKIEKCMKSKQGAEAAKHCEYIIRQINGYHSTKEDIIQLRQEAQNTLDKLINHLFIGLSNTEKEVLSNSIYAQVITKWNEMVNKLGDMELYNVNKAGTSILNAAMRRDSRINKIESILCEIQKNGQSAPTRIQKREMRKNLKRAEHDENRRIQYVKARVEALAENEKIAKSNGMDVYRAYEFIHMPPEAPAKSKLKPLIVK